MDLSVVLNNQKLNIRACAIIIHDNKLLVHNNVNESHVALVGGRVKIGESSEQTLKREIMEEMGKEIEILEYVSTIENFFEADDMPYHEIMFVYRIDFKNEEDKKIIETFKKLVELSNNIVFLGGAGVSTESEIPEFRSKDGLYKQVLTSSIRTIGKTDLMIVAGTSLTVYPESGEIKIYLTKAKLIL